MRETVALTDDWITELEAKGWKREDLEHARDVGAEYAPKRASLLFPMEVR